VVLSARPAFLLVLLSVTTAYGCGGSVSPTPSFGPDGVGGPEWRPVDAAADAVVPPDLGDDGNAKEVPVDPDAKELGPGDTTVPELVEDKSDDEDAANTEAVSEVHPDGEEAVEPADVTQESTPDADLSADEYPADGDTTSETLDGADGADIPQDLHLDLFVDPGIHAVACLPCMADDECVVPGKPELGTGRCFDLGQQGHYCATPCATSECPDGFLCIETIIGQEIEWLCLPDAQACQCPDPLPVAAAWTECVQESLYGKCFGKRYCAGGELTPCDAPVPDAEACDGVDNNCDGTFDEGYFDSDADMLADCVDEDDDGDGIPDSVDNCPLLPTPDTGDNDQDGHGDKCDNDDDNDASLDGADCMPFNPQVYPGNVETCNGQDDDCDLEIDEGLATTTCGLGACQVTVQSCVDGVPADCVPLEPQIEACDGLDNDCNGAVDEVFVGLGVPCDGPDTDKCNNGATVCSPDGIGVVCGPESEENLPEKCFDGLDNDCVSWTPDACVLESCKALKATNPGIASGIYSLDPDVGGPILPFNVYCEMKDDGGGWTLVMKVDGAKDTFNYWSALWNNTTVFAGDKPNLDANEAKLASFHTVPFAEVRVGLKVGEKTSWLVVPKAASSMLEVMNGAYQPTTLGRKAWKDLIKDSSLQPNCNKEGFNVIDPCSSAWDVGPNGVARVRIGIVGNNELNCCSPDSRLGIGAGGAYCGQDPKNTCGNEASSYCGTDAGDKHVKAFGYVMVR